MAKRTNAPVVTAAEADTAEADAPSTHPVVSALETIAREAGVRLDEHSPARKAIDEVASALTA